MFWSVFVSSLNFFFSLSLHWMHHGKKHSQTSSSRFNLQLAILTTFGMGTPWSYHKSCKMHEREAIYSLNWTAVFHLEQEKQYCYKKNCNEKQYYSSSFNCCDVQHGTSSKLNEKELDCEFRSYLAAGYVEQWARRHICDLIGGWERILSTKICHDFAFNTTNQRFASHL